MSKVLCQARTRKSLRVFSVPNMGVSGPNSKGIHHVIVPGSHFMMLSHNPTDTGHGTRPPLIQRGSRGELASSLEARRANLHWNMVPTDKSHKHTSAGVQRVEVIHSGVSGYRCS